MGRGMRFLVPQGNTPASRRFHKYGRLGRMPGVIGVAAAIGIVLLAKRILPTDSQISLESFSHRALASYNATDSSSHELHACEGITLNDFDENGGVVVFLLIMVYVFLGALLTP